MRTDLENVAVLKSGLARQQREASRGRCLWVTRQGGGAITPAESLLMALTPSTFLISKFSPCSQTCFHLHRDISRNKKAWFHQFYGSAVKVPILE